MFDLTTIAMAVRLLAVLTAAPSGGTEVGPASAGGARAFPHAVERLAADTVERGGPSAARPAPSGLRPGVVDAELRAVIEEAGAAPIDPPIPASPEMVELGRALFFDKILSGNRNIACASCHHPNAASGDGLSLPFGEGGKGEGSSRRIADGELIPRNSPPVFNLGHPGMTTMFWDGRLQRDPRTGALWTPEPGLNGPDPALAHVAAPLESALAAQAMFPPTSADEMRGQPGENEIANAASNEEVWERLMLRLVGDGTAGSGIEEYRALFRRAFPAVEDVRDLTFGHAAAAIGAFESTAFVADDSRFDRYLRGDDRVLSPREKNGAALFFGAAGCSGCHEGALLTDLEFHALAVPQLGPGKREAGEDMGRAEVTGLARDAYAFRTPPLRNVAATGPWMHDGAYDRLEEAVRHHLDPVSANLAFDANRLAVEFRGQRDGDFIRRRARIQALEATRSLGTTTLTEGEIGDLVLFLRALTDPSSLDLGRLVPDRVPSGLPVGH